MLKPAVFHLQKILLSDVCLSLFYSLLIHCIIEKDGEDFRNQRNENSVRFFFRFLSILFRSPLNAAISRKLQNLQRRCRKTCSKGAQAMAEIDRNS